MAKKKSGESTMGYFKRVFKSNPKWLNETSNDAVIAKYKEDHGIGVDADVDKSIKNSLSNVKSVLRKELRTKGDAPGRPRRTIKVVAAKGSIMPPLSLETLEEVIDDSLTMARNFGLDKHHNVVRHLRAARNEVVWMGGQK